MRNSKIIRKWCEVVVAQSNLLAHGHNNQIKPALNNKAKAWSAEVATCVETQDRLSLLPQMPPMKAPHLARSDLKDKRALYSSKLCSQNPRLCL